MKRFTLLLAILTLTAVGAFAEVVTIKGKLTTTNRRHPEITSGGTTYFLMMPRIIVRDLKDGEEITITARGKTVDVEKEFAGAKKGMDRRGEPGSMKGKGGMKGGRGCCGE